MADLERKILSKLTRPAEIGRVWELGLRAEALVRGLSGGAASPLYEGGPGGEGVGPRYCPSLEAKARRFPGRRHLVWLEPEGHTTHVVYPNGLSMGFDPEEQLRVLRTVPGLVSRERERVKEPRGGGAREWCL